MYTPVCTNSPMFVISHDSNESSSNSFSPHLLNICILTLVNPKPFNLKTSFKSSLFGENAFGIENEHWIVDIGAAKVADTPEHFDVVVMPNLHGDVISDISAQITGSVGLCGSSNIGEECAMFEAIHGSAPDIAGRNIANPSALINGSLMMLNHIGQSMVAKRIHNAWLTTIEQGIHTADIYDEKTSSKKVGTSEFAEAVISNLGNKPTSFDPITYGNRAALKLPKYQKKAPAQKDLVGIDLFAHWNGTNPDEIAEMLQSMETDTTELVMITNRGIKVWPNGFEETFCTDHWRCRFQSKGGASFDKNEIIQLMQNAVGKGIDIIKTENLYAFDGKRAYSLGQGQ